MLETLVTDALATYRLTRLATQDKITEPLRERLVRAGYRESPSAAIAAKVHTLLTCPWCMGWWCACGVVAARTFAPRSWEPIAKALALSAATGIIADNA